MLRQLQRILQLLGMESTAQISHRCWQENFSQRELSAGSLYYDKVMVIERDVKALVRGSSRHLSQPQQPVQQPEP